MSLQYAAVAPAAIYIHELNEYQFLDETYEMLQFGLVENGMDLLVPKLHDLYASTSTSEWTELVNQVLLAHPLKNLLMQDPLTTRSFRQPRGYAGDAALLDMVYYFGSHDKKEISELGRKLFRYTTHTPLSLTLCKRMRLLTDYIDKSAEEMDSPRVLSVASGHCREATRSQALQNNRVSRFVALDHDAKSLRKMNELHSHLNLEAVPLSVSDIVKGKSDIGEFDLIYSAGLYDYLSKRFAQKLTSRLYSMLAPGGKLVLCNIATNYYEVGYLESYMNWQMIGRDKSDVLEFAADLEGGEQAIIRVKETSEIQSHFNILEIEKF